jgi:hypothetical protein
MIDALTGLRAIVNHYAISTRKAVLGGKTLRNQHYFP